LAEIFVEWQTWHSIEDTGFWWSSGSASGFRIGFLDSFTIAKWDLSLCAGLPEKLQADLAKIFGEV